MEAASVASSGTGLRCSINPVRNPPRISAGVRFTTTKRQPCAATSRRLLLPPSARANTAAIDSGAGYPGVSRKRLAVFVSGGGSNFRSIHEAALGGKVNGDVAVLVTDKPGEDALVASCKLWTVR
jgi:phosphoribosylglycinamide formyltransferase